MQTRDVRGQKMPKNANVICERPLKEAEVLDRQFDFDIHFHLNTKNNSPRFGFILKVCPQKITGYLTKKVNY